MKQIIVARARGFALAALLLLLMVPAGDGTAAAQFHDHGIVIVPLEAPPLTFGPGVDVEAVVASNIGGGVSYSLGDATAQAGRTLWLLSGIAMLVDAPRQSRLADRRAESAEEILNAKDAWLPTVVLAQEARTQLHAAGVDQVRVAEGVRALPGIEDRRRTMTMHNWYKPAKDWFDRDTSPFAYGEPEIRPGDLVLEVGLGNYEVMTDTMFVMVYAKLVDPATSATISRQRRYTYPTVGKIELLFRGDADGFKAKFTDVTRPMLRECLQNMKLLPSP